MERAPKELLGFNIVLAPGTTILIAMNFDDTLNDLARKLNMERGYKLKDITVGGSTYQTDYHGRLKLT